MFDSADIRASEPHFGGALEACGELIVHAAQAFAHP
jgi:hypothetical protein